MDSDWASEHLQVIRTLMERAAVYRRALAPIMLAVGVLGCLAAGTALFTGRFDSNRAFAGLWVGTAAGSIVVSYLLARRQALKEQEPFWSPPTRRVTQALAPGFVAGAAAGFLAIAAGEGFHPLTWWVALAWMLAYGCALHSAGFFMHRGIKLFGLCCTVFGAGLLIVSGFEPELRTAHAAHLAMGFFFGALHLSYGAYLHFTERHGEA